MPTAAFASGLQSVFFLNGCWTQKNAKELITENWTKSDEQHMNGVSQTIVNGKTVQVESLQIILDEVNRKI